MFLKNLEFLGKTNERKYQLDYLRRLYDELGEKTYFGKVSVGGMYSH